MSTTSAEKLDPIESHHRHIRSTGLSRSMIKDQEHSAETAIQSDRPPQASWASMPHRDQLAILALSRLVDFFQMASLQTFMVHQLQSFDPSLPDSSISRQAGILQGSFTAAQIITAVLWGRVADEPNVGRKNVLLIGLIGTAFSCIGLGFSRSFTQAALWRLLGGAINGTVGAARTMVAETVEKRFHSRAFLLLPIAFNVANILGPILGGMLVDPVTSFPALLGPGSVLGGPEGVAWMIKHPYAATNMLSATLLFAEAALVYFFLRETLASYAKPTPSAFGLLDTSRGLLARLVPRRQSDYRVLDASQSVSLLTDIEGDAINMTELNPEGYLEKPYAKPKLPFSRLWTSNVILTLLSIAIFDFHMGAFSSLWIIFLSTERAEKHHAARSPSGPFHFDGGLSFQPTAIGFALAVIGFVGLALQLSLYPWANSRLGLMRCFRYALFLFPVAYFLAPYISLLPSWSDAPQPASGPWIWIGISVVLTLQVTARTFALPASIILLNNSSPHPSVLATIHGLGSSTSSMFRTVGPIAAGFWYGVGLEMGAVGMAWWIVAGISCIGCIASFWMRDGSGREILLPGDKGYQEIRETEARTLD
ncbi:hypothetical protein H2201_003879 [Coniosporium apollinis]|uniref:Major facilitator superfamily (MFS) profile domain-containing protein n=1 Tax=Coniosporium apollinis TaxID=61459 RepID=A0ABQ9NVK0_9PEZI|nr:hypothetical protein H2201_003879 [Coniosporium apollinis]